MGVEAQIAGAAVSTTSTLLNSGYLVVTVFMLLVILLVAFIVVLIRVNVSERQETKNAYKYVVPVLEKNTEAIRAIDTTVKIIGAKIK